MMGHELAPSGKGQFLPDNFQVRPARTQSIRSLK